jgi:transcriptional regulator with XRE-family HTH domain
MTKMERESPDTDSKKFTDEKQQPTNLLSRRALWSRLRSGANARVRFVESNLSKNLAFQIRALRDRKDWSQGELGKRVEMTQNAISRLENPFYGKATLTTLKRIAAAFDVALVVRFVPFGQLIDWVSGTPFSDPGMSSLSLSPANFASECRVAELGSVPVTGSSHRHEPELGSFQQASALATSAASQLAANRQVA